MDVAMKFEAEMLARQKGLSEAVGESDVQRFYRDRVIFITGGSGFLGKQLIEKLLRSCKVSKIYMLLRPKKGKNMQERLKDLLKESVFDKLREQDLDFASKITTVQGDVAEINLGLNGEDWKMLTEEVHVIFHVAATTRFDETLRTATLINIRGTRECLGLGRVCKRLRSYVHVSTAYAHATYRLVGEDVQEKFYESPVPPNAMISMATDMDTDRLLSISNSLIKDWPNTYSFTKAIAEELIRTSSDGLPICIVRPGIVMCSNSEPSPGWVDKSAVYSAAGIVLGVGVGVMHTILANKDASLGIVPCDYVNNAIIAAGREAAVTQKRGGNDTRIYTVSPTYRNPCKWRDWSHTMRTESYKYSSPFAVYYTYAIETKNTVIFMILSLFLHMFPAFVADCICLLLGKERRFVKLARKVYIMCNVLSYFLQNEWQLVDNNTYELYKGLSEKDKREFNFDVGDINWSEYVVINWCLGIRKHIIKDGLKGTDYALKKQKILAVVHYATIVFYFYVIWKIFSFLLFNVLSLKCSS